MSTDVANTIIAIAAIAQALGTIAAIYFTWSVARDQANNATTIAREQAQQAADLKAEDRAREGATRDARANIAAFRLIPVVEEIHRELERLAAISTNAAQIEALKRSLARAGVPAKETWIPPLAMKVGWSDSLYQDFDALPPTLARRAAALLYKVEQYDRIVEDLVLRTAGDTQQMAAALRTAQDGIRADLNIVRAALNTFAPALPPAAVV